MLMILLLDQHAAYITMGRLLGSISRFASKFRTGNHYLKIETGRLRIPKTPEDLRFYDHCNQNSVENELHTLFHCDQDNDLRKTLLLKSTTEIHYLQITISTIKSVFLVAILIHISAG